MPREMVTCAGVASEFGRPRPRCPPSASMRSNSWIVSRRQRLPHQRHVHLCICPKSTHRQPRASTISESGSSGVAALSTSTGLTVPSRSMVRECERSWPRVPPAMNRS